MKARGSHAVGIVTDLVTDEQLVTVTGGLSCGVLPSTEILQDGEWVQGKINETIYHTRAIISRSRFEDALVYKPRILNFEMKNFHF